MLRQILHGTVIAAAMLASGSAALAEGTPEQRSACIGDAFRLCGTEIPDVGRITACMKANYSQLSPGCKAVFFRAPVASR